jgi:hypothetical protein
MSPQAEIKFGLRAICRLSSVLSLCCFIWAAILPMVDTSILSGEIPQTVIRLGCLFLSSVRVQGFQVRT